MYPDSKHQSQETLLGVVEATDVFEAYGIWLKKMNISDIIVVGIQIYQVDENDKEITWDT
jgi:hypothetical protein